VLWIAGFYFITDLFGLDLVATLGRINPLSVLLGFALYSLAVLSSIWILYRCLKGVHLKPPIAGIGKAWIFGSFIDNIGPTVTPLGEASMAYFLEKFYGVSYVKSLAAIGMYVSAWGLSVSFFSIISLFVVHAFEGLQNLISGPAIALVVVAVLIFVVITAGWFLLIMNRRLVERIVCKIIRIYNRIYNKFGRRKITFEKCVFQVEFDKSYNALEMFMKNKRQMLGYTVVFAVPQITHVLCMYFILLGFGVHVPFLAILLVHIVSSVAGLVSFIPSGTGVYELVSSSTLTAVIPGAAPGMAAAGGVAVAAVFLYRLVFVWTTNFVGGLVGIVQGVEQTGHLDKAPNVVN
jgi:uncharacterized protein (TIRG00374 family)